MTNANMAIRRAKQISKAKIYKDKCKAVHAWHDAVQAMLKGVCYQMV